MRYGHPGTGEALEALAALPDIEEIVIVPLYPHYARSSYETAVAFALEEIRRLGLRPIAPASASALLRGDGLPHGLSR